MYIQIQHKYIYKYISSSPQVCESVAKYSPPKSKHFRKEVKSGSVKWHCSRCSYKCHCITYATLTNKVMKELGKMVKWTTHWHSTQTHLHAKIHTHAERRIFTHTHIHTHRNAYYERLYVSLRETPQQNELLQLWRTKCGLQLALLLYIVKLTSSKIANSKRYNHCITIYHIFEAATAAIWRHATDGIAGKTAKLLAKNAYCHS